MRLGVLSDLHANLPALEAALEALRAEGVDEVLVLGDLVGYGPHPRQVIHRIWEEGLAAICSAHGTARQTLRRTPLLTRG